MIKRYNDESGKKKKKLCEIKYNKKSFNAK